ncbi:MAG: caspase family protein, partial [Candidatus Brocadiales bacterium]|nr:caspase family protein [Candidatus Brocadiales bacterium]
GDKYVGEFKNGKKDGQGTKTWASGRKYVGEWKDDKMNGQGTYTWASGNKYVGEWKDDKMNGQFTVTYANGNKYVGEFKDGEKDGQGTFTWAGEWLGQKYVGEWKNGKRNGQGTLTFVSGDKYVGEWKDNKKNGQGTKTWASGRKYVGEWENDTAFGYGIYTRADGRIESGIYKNLNTVDKRPLEEVEAYLTTKYPEEKRGPVSTSDEIVSLPPILNIKEISFPAGYLEAEKTQDLYITIQNTGPGDGRDIEVRLTGEKLSGLSYPAKTITPVIPAYTGEKTIQIAIQGLTNLAEGKATIHIEIFEPNFYLSKTAKLLSFPTYKLETPKLVLAKYAVKEFQKSNNQVDKNEMITVEFIVQNTDIGVAEDVSISISNSQTGVRGFGEVINGVITGKMKLNSIATIKSGNYESITYSYLIDNRFSGKELTFNIEVTERRGEYGFSETIHQGINTTLVAEGRLKQPNKRRKKRQGVVIEDVPDLVVDVDVEIPKTGMKNPYAFAVVIGNRNYQKTKPVDYAINDATTIRQYLIQTLGYKEGNIFFVKDAKLGDFQSLFGKEGNHRGKLFNAAKHNKSDVFVFYSGHGAPGLKDRKGYFIPVDCEPNQVELNGYSLDVLFENLSKIQAQSVVVVTDACFSGADIFENISPIIPTIRKPLMTMNNSIVLSSSSGAQRSSWYNEKKHGMFTYFFLKAIHNRNADFNRDGKLTFYEVYRYISNNSEGVPYYARFHHNVEQTPTLEGSGDKNRVLVRY